MDTVTIALSLVFYAGSVYGAYRYGLVAGKPVAPTKVEKPKRAYKRKAAAPKGKPIDAGSKSETAPGLVTHLAGDLGSLHNKPNGYAAPLE